MSFFIYIASNVQKFVYQFNFQKQKQNIHSGNLNKIMVKLGRVELWWLPFFGKKKGFYNINDDISMFMMM
ncbi:hypothetical protein CN601_19035 [Bacillus sp. AFS017336]|nr:hypothetical protein CN601_19035 [Bacillus sp. AFS017336]